MIQLYNLFLYQPLFNILIFLYNLSWRNLGLAIIILTVLIKLLLWPLSNKSTRAQKKLQTIQPKLDEIKKKYKDNREQQAKATMELYRQEKINPLSSCLPLLIQFPFIIAVFQVFRTGLKSESLNLLYPFINNPGNLNTYFFGLFNLTSPNAVLAVLAGISQYWQTKMLVGKKQAGPAAAKEGEESFATIMNKQMLYMMPIMTVFIGMTLPSGLALYWLVSTLLTIIQQVYIFKEKETDK